MSSLSVTSQPSESRADSPFLQQPSVALIDLYSSPVTAYSGSVVAAFLPSNHLQTLHCSATGGTLTISIGSSKLLSGSVTVAYNAPITAEQSGFDGSRCFANSLTRLSPCLCPCLCPCPCFFFIFA